MKLNILISTINEGIYKIKDIFLPLEENISYIVSHQITNDKDYSQEISLLQQREDVKYVSLCTKGLSKNRNNCLRYADGDIVYICDDDVRLAHHSVLAAIRRLEEDESIDVLRCQIETFDGKPYKYYNTREYVMRHITQLTSISSIEMIVKKAFLKENNILFDERFGLGSPYPTGEDFVFAVDIFRKNGKIVHFPRTIALHEDEGTGSKLSDSVIYARGAVFARVFGFAGFLANLYVALKQRKKYKSKYSFYDYLKLMCLGSLNFIRKER